MTNEPPTSGPAPRKARKAKKIWGSELARQAHANQRRKLAREASLRKASEMKHARQELERAEQRLINEEDNRRLNMVANGLAPRLTAVMNSWGINMPVKLTPDGSISAFTDFKRITVKYDRRLTSSWGTAPVVTNEALRQIAAETRGLFYHEVGHNLFSVPISDLLTLAWLDGYRPKTRSLYPKYTNTPSGTLELRKTPVPKNVTWPYWEISDDFQAAWNTLEDQRMEAALVEDSPQIAAYLTVLVLRNIVTRHTASQPTAWALVAGRKYLPASTRRHARTLWNEYVPGVSADDLEAVIDRYLAAETPNEMLACIEEFLALTNVVKLMVGFDNHKPMVMQRARPEAPKNGQTEKITVAAEKASKAESKDDEEDEGFGPSASSDMDGEADDKGEGTQGSSDDSDETGDDAGQGEGGGHDEFGRPDEGRPDHFQDDLNDALDDLDNDEALDDDVASMNTAYGTDDGSLPAYGSAGTLDDDELLAQAQAIVDDMVQAFNIATADCTPHWESGQRRGVIEAIRYRTRQPGDMEFFRAYADDGDPGSDIAVSLFLDVSGSMGGSTNALGASAWAAKVACQSLNVDCDVTLFDSGAWRLWAADENVDEAPSINSHGSTNPQMAFDAVLRDERDKKHHLVLIMTDGDWSDKKVLRDHRHPNMRTMIFNYGGYGYATRGRGARPNPRMALELFADEAYDIDDLLDIPRALESMLVSVV